jgi:hypothetical protein
MVAVVLVGCATNTTKSDNDQAHRRGQVSGNLIEAPAADQYAASPGIRFQQPTPSPDNALPDYPSRLLSQHLAGVEIKIRLVVDEHGAVIQTQPLQAISDPLQPFLRAVESAVSHWQFIPLIKLADAPGSSTVVIGDTSLLFDGQATALPFHQDYAFTFEQVNGQPIVHAATNATSH